MLEVIDATNTEAMNVIEPLATDFTPETTDPQTEIGEAITNLWSAHLNAKNTARATNEELRTIRAKLGEQLSKMKQILAKPGRDGQWSGFLREHNIPRSTGDRLVSRHLRSLDPNANCTIEPIFEPPNDDVQKLFAAVWPKLKRTLRSRQSADLFVRLITARCECGEMRDRESPVVTQPTVAFGPESSDGDSVPEPELCSAPPLGPDHATICAS
jgi:hypothetical protein